ncbi:hypothetical protein BS17DRAFT_788537 [Gyrodon lividus]|nr:hypothetical protein BS17DRAFT_788537 [Gyrodon lividus]
MNKDYPPKPDTDERETVLPQAAPPAEQDLMPENPSPSKPREETRGEGGVKTATPSEVRGNVGGPEGTDNQAGPDKHKERKKAAAAGVGMMGVAVGAGALDKEGS